MVHGRKERVASQKSGARPFYFQPGEKTNEEPQVRRGSPTSVQTRIFGKENKSRENAELAGMFRSCRHVKAPRNSVVVVVGIIGAAGAQVSCDPDSVGRLEFRAPGHRMCIGPRLFRFVSRVRSTCVTREEERERERMSEMVKRAAFVTCSFSFLLSWTGGVSSFGAGWLWFSIAFFFLPRRAFYSFFGARVSRKLADGLCFSREINSATLFRVSLMRHSLFCRALCTFSPLAPGKRRNDTPRSMFRSTFLLFVSSHLIPITHIKVTNLKPTYNRFTPVSSCNIRHLVWLTLILCIILIILLSLKIHIIRCELSYKQKLRRAVMSTVLKSAILKHTERQTF